MKKRLSVSCWLAFAAFWPLLSAAQITGDSAFVLIYKVSAVQARDWYVHSYIAINADTLGTPIDSSYNFSNWRPPMPGHYVSVWASDEQVNARLNSFTSFIVETSYSPRHLLVQVFDSLGKALPQAQVSFRGKTMRYNARLSVFELPRQHKDGMLTVSLGEETAFYQLNSNSSYSPARQRWQRIRRSAPMRVLLFPYNAVRKTWRFVRWGIRRGDWHLGYLFPMRRQRDFGGYLAFSKPRYLPGDTVKMAAQVARHNGKPVHHKLRFSLSYYVGNTGKTALNITLKPDKIPGYYQYQWKLPDSLPLNINMNAQLVRSKNEDKGVYGDFRYEDYQLDEVEYTLQPDTAVVIQGRPAILRATGKDKNGFPVTGGSVRLSLLAAEVSDFYDTLVVVPDTLWTHQQDLDEEGEAVISIPDAIWPRADFSVLAKAVFSNDKGELQERSCSFAYSMAKPVLYLQDDTLIASWIGGQPATGGLLVWQRPGSSDAARMAVNLPYRMLIDAGVRQYTLQAGGRTVALNPDQFNNGVSLYAYRKNDTLWTQWNNLRNLTIGFRVFDRKKVLYDEQITGRQQTWQGKIPAEASVRVEYYFVWAGKNMFEEEEIPLYSKLLNITTNQIGDITPGATTPVEVKVNDYKGRPVKKARLTAGAINSQFSSTGNFEPPEIYYKQKIAPISYGNYHATLHNALIKKKTINPYWYQALHLNRQLFYRLLFEGDGVYAERDSSYTGDFYKNIAQFAPYIVKNGQYQPIHLIYCNRQLVYSYDVNDQPRYSFIGMEGKNDIILRTTNAEYSIAGVTLRKGQKLELAIHADKWSGSAMKSAISYKPMPAEWTQQEKLMLNRQILLLRKMSSPLRYVWNEKKSIHLITNTLSDPIKLGPFVHGETLNYLVRNGFKTSFLFDAGFAYEIFPQRERLYAMTLYPDNQRYYLPSSLPAPVTGLPVFSPADIVPHVEEESSINYTKYAEYSRKAGMATLRLRYGRQKNDSLLVAVILQRDTSDLIVSAGEMREWKALPPGQYALWLISRTGHYYSHKKINLKANAHTLIDLDAVTFEKDTAGFIPRKLLRNYISKKEPLSNIYQSFKQGGYGLRGVITDDAGEPLIGASILIKGTTTGTVTDVDGEYYIDVPPGVYTLVVAYTGFNTQEIENVNMSVGYGGIVDVSLSSGNMLSEVVVTGYGVVREKKSLATSSVQVDNLSGKVGGIMIRGLRSAALDYYVDGARVKARDEVKPLQPAVMRSDFRDEAYWKPGLVTNRRGKAYFSATYPDNITAWNTYVVAMDRKGRAAFASGRIKAYKPLVAQLAVPRFLVRGDAANVLGTVLNTRGDSLEVLAKFGGAAMAADTRQLLRQAFTLKAALAPEASLLADTVSVEFTAQSPEAADGELRKIPVMPRGVKETNGAFWMLEGDTTFTASIAAAGEAPLQVYAQDNILPLLLADLEELQNYPYGCNEQASSKLTALLLEKDVRKALGQPFAGDKAIAELLGKLTRAQHPAGGWGWWPGNEPVGEMTIYVLQALAQAQRHGYTVPAFERGMRLLTADLPRIQGRNLLQSLALMAENDQALDYEAYLGKVKTEKADLYDRLLDLHIRQLRGLPHSLDTLLKYEQRTMLGGSYWGQYSYRQLFSGDIGCTLLAYKIAQSAGRTDLTKRIRHFLVEKRGNTGWRNTIETAQILNTLLADLPAANDATMQAAALYIDGKQVKMPYSADLPPGQNALQISKRGLGPIYLTAYRQWQQTEPQRQSGAFEVTTLLEQNGKATQTLTHGQAAKLSARINLKESADYVMIEIPIPAGCSYLETRQPGWNSVEVHREYRRDRVVVFCKYLPAGSHDFTVELEPRFTGRYALNPAKAELMYFPTFFGREGMKTVDIKEDTGK